MIILLIALLYIIDIIYLLWLIHFLKLIIVHLQRLPLYESLFLHVEQKKIRVKYTFEYWIGNLQRTKKIFPIALFRIKTIKKLN